MAIILFNKEDNRITVRDESKKGHRLSPLLFMKMNIISPNYSMIQKPDTDSRNTKMNDWVTYGERKYTKNQNDGSG